MQKWLIFILAANVFLLGGCGRDGRTGKDGKDGKAYIAYKWNYNPFYYTTTDPGIAHPVINRQYYETIPGTYYFTYQSWDGSVWSGNYTVTVNKGGKGTKGEKGGIFWQNGRDGKDGQNGADNYFQLYCPSGGPYFYQYNYAAYSGNSFLNIRLEELTQADMQKKGSPLLPEAERDKLTGQPLK